MAKPTVKASQLINKNVHVDIKGTRLAAHLLDIRNRFGVTDTVIRQLAEKALANPYAKAGESSVLTAVRDRLHAHADLPAAFAPLDPHQQDAETYSKSARDLATGINWHRVANKLDLDKRVEETLRSWSKEGVDQATLMRAAHALAQNNLKSEDPGSRKLLNALHRHAMSNWHGKDSGYGGTKADLSHEELAKSIERLANKEGYKEQLQDRGQKQLKEGRETVGAKPFKSGPVDAVDTLNWLPGKGAAYKVKGDKFVPQSGLDAEQYSRLSNQLLRFAGVGKQNQGLGGVYWRQTADSYADPSHPAHIERLAVGRLLHNLGVIDLSNPDPENNNARKIHEYTSALHNLVHHEPGDLLADHYRRFIRQVSNRVPHTELYMKGLQPLVNWAVVKKFGERTWDQIRDRNKPAEIDLADPGVNADEELPIAEEVPGRKRQSRKKLRVDGKIVPDADVIKIGDTGTNLTAPEYDELGNPVSKRAKRIPKRLVEGQIKIPTTEPLKKLAKMYNALLTKLKFNK